MALFEIGELIVKLRKQRGLSLSELAEGITDKANLSRIESGKQQPSKFILDALLQRLEFDSSAAYHFFDEENYELNLKKINLRVLTSEKKNDEAQALLNEIYDKPEFQKSLGRQFLMSAQAAIMLNKNENTAEIKTLILEALKISIPAFEESKIKEYILTDEDITLINNLAITYSRNNQTEKAIALLTELKDNIENAKVIGHHITGKMPLVYFNLSKWLGLSGRYTDSIKVCDTALVFCIKNNNMYLLPEIIYNKSWCLGKLGDMQLCKRLLCQAVYGIDMRGDYFLRDMMIKNAENNFGIKIDVF